MQYGVIEEYASWIPYDMTLLKSFNLYEVENERMNELMMKNKHIKGSITWNDIDQETNRWRQDKHYDR